MNVHTLKTCFPGDVHVRADYVTPAGSRSWRYRYRIGKSERTYSIGRYPAISLEEARRERDRAYGLVRQGIHPLVDRKLKVSLQLDRNDNTFESCARNWMKSNTTWSGGYRKQVTSYMENDVFPVLGMLPVAAITVSSIHPLILDISERGAVLAMAVRQWISQVFNYAAQQGVCEHNPAAMLKRLIKKPLVRHHPPLPWGEIPALMSNIENWNGHYLTKMALRLLSLTFVRTIELRRATWDQFNLDAAMWLIPAENMKMRCPHMVPLSRQVVDLLKQLHQVTGSGRLLLPNARRPDEPIGPTTLNNALCALGFRGVFSAHGFRSTATTLLSLLGYPDNRVDLQLAHMKRNDSSRAPYDHTKYISSRRVLMQDWADIWELFSQGHSMAEVTRQFGPLSTNRMAFLGVIEREQ
ncbi:MAG: tyrosine-type recombinase/integrase [Alcaligenaceae bacterium]|nr:tyrosine-type recombinase/integrase [Alcaligenaceae bacterium]